MIRMFNLNVWSEKKRLFVIIYVDIVKYDIDISIIFS